MNKAEKPCLRAVQSWKSDHASVAHGSRWIKSGGNVWGGHFHKGRFLFAWLVITATVPMQHPKLTQPYLKTHAIRRLYGSVGVSRMFPAAAAIPPSDAVVTSFRNPVLGMNLAIPLLGDRVGRWRWG